MQQRFSEALLSVSCVRFTTQHNPDEPEVSQARINELVDAFASSSEKNGISKWREAIDPDLLKTHRSFKMRHFQASGLVQYMCCFGRNVRSMYRDPLNVSMSIVVCTAIGLILGLSYHNPGAKNAPVDREQVKNMAGLFFLSNLNMFFTCLYSTVMAFAGETKVFMRENQAGANRYVCSCLYRCPSYGSLN